MYPKHKHIGAENVSRRLQIVCVCVRTTIYSYVYVVFQFQHCSFVCVSLEESWMKDSIKDRGNLVSVVLLRFSQESLFL